MSRVRGRNWVPHGLVVLWLLFIGLTVWGHARRAAVPPIADAFLYFQKGQSVWRGLHVKHFVNPLDAEPASRGPGTVLMSAPFGFNPNFKPFFFRSIFFAVLFFVVGLYFAAFEREMPLRSHWNLAILAIFLSSLPLFYHFEGSDVLPGPTYWGLVDNFLAGISALAAGASIRSVRNRSFIWWMLAVLFTCISLLTKPAGAVVIVAIDLAWGFALVLEFLRAERTAKKGLAMLVGIGTVTAVLIQGGLIGLCLRSSYLTVDAGMAGLRWVRAYAHPAVTPELLHVIMLHSFGYILPATTIVALLLYIRNRRNFRPELTVVPVYLVASGVTLLVGLWFWIITTDVGQDRYFYPFATASIIYAGPAILASLAQTRKRSLLLFRVLWIVPCLNLALLLVQRDPSVKWQQWSGVSLTTGGQRSEVAQAKELLERVRVTGKNAVAYATVSTPAYTFSSVAAYNALVQPGKPYFSVQLPIDNQTEPVYRMADIAGSDFIVFPPVLDPRLRNSVLRVAAIKTFPEEELLLRAWLTNLTENDGVNSLSETSVRVLKITDKVKLLASLERLVSSYSWPARFVDQNPKVWWNLKELQHDIPSLAPQISNIKFGDVVDLYALVVKEDQGFTKVQLWWKWIDPPQQEWQFFCHIIDQNGAILENHAIPLDKQSSPSPEFVRLDSLSFQSARRDGYGIAVGVFAPGSAILQADRGNSIASSPQLDWNNRRVVVLFSRMKIADTSVSR